MNRNGQSIIEYSLIAVLVILGVVYMGPYVLRSVNAHFKLWDDSIQDSFTENITQAPLNDVPFINSTCNCWYSDGGCGASGNGVQCPANQKIENLHCDSNSILGCTDSPLSICKTPADNSCCLQYWQQGCGTIPIPTGGLPAGGSVPTTISGPSGDPIFSSTACTTYAFNNTGAAPNCYYGQHLYSTECSSSASTPVACCPDAACNPICKGIDSPGVIACPGAQTGLDQNYNLTYVTTCSSTGPKCQVYCDNANGYFLNSSGTACTNTITLAPSISSCAATEDCNPSDCKPGYTSVNNCSKTLCIAPTATNPNPVITNATLTDTSMPQTYPYCDTPQGNPGEFCQVNFTYHEQ